MTQEEIEYRRCKEECAALYVAYAIAVDHRDYDRIMTLFTPDAVYDRGMGPASTGHAQIRATLDARSTQNVVRHVMTNMEIQPLDARRARGICYFTAYNEPGTDDNAVGIPLHGPAYVGEIHATFSKTADGWKIQSYIPRLTFVRKSS